MVNKHPKTEWIQTKNSSICSRSIYFHFYVNKIFIRSVKSFFYRIIAFHKCPENCFWKNMEFCLFLCFLQFFWKNTWSWKNIRIVCFLITISIFDELFLFCIFLWIMLFFLFLNLSPVFFYFLFLKKWMREFEKLDSVC